MKRTLLLVGLAVLTALAAPVQAKPAAVPAPRASQQEINAVRSWVDQALLGKVGLPLLPPSLTVTRQDYGALHLNTSVLGTPLQISAVHYDHGLGTHVTSEILVRLPAHSTRFTAQVGIDNNYDTAGVHGATIFAVTANNKILFQSQVCHGGDAPVPVDIPVTGLQSITLHVYESVNGPFWGQSDWANAQVANADGTTLFLDQLPVHAATPGFSTDLPYSFIYNGRPSQLLLPTWKRSYAYQWIANGRERHTVTFRDPATGLTVRCAITRFTNSPAVEWVLSFQNNGTADTPIIQNILPLNLQTTTTTDPVVLHRVNGSTASDSDYLPVDAPIATNSTTDLAPNGGRSSDGVLPFFNLECNGGGFVSAVGWSGQWALHMVRSNGEQVAMQAGQQTTHFLLHPGEEVRTPRILLVSWQGGDYLTGTNTLRKLLLDQYVPKLNNQPIIPPLSMTTWFQDNDGNTVTEQNQTAIMPSLAALDLDAFWMDAGWFQGGWPGGAGNWFADPARFPNGLGPVGAAAHNNGLKFVLWFEPERVEPGTEIATNNPQWLLHAPSENSFGSLLNLGDPAARAWITNRLSSDVTQGSVDVLRLDFNLAPLDFWNATDTPDRQGITENHYIEGLYQMWDDLRAQHPGMTIDNCASGGRRVDLETISRSYQLWQSDSQGSVRPVPDQVENVGLSLYVPLHSGALQAFDPYNYRSSATMGGVITVALPQDVDSQAALRARIDETKSLRQDALGDLYPLTPITLDQTAWCAWQYNRSDLGQGYFVCFRRAQSPDATETMTLRGLDPAANYRVTNADTQVVATLTGAALAQYQVTLSAVNSSALFTYQKQ